MARLTLAVLSASICCARAHRSHAPETVTLQESELLDIATDDTASGEALFESTETTGFIITAPDVVFDMDKFNDRWTNGHPDTFVDPKPDWSADRNLTLIHIGKCGGTSLVDWITIHTPEILAHYNMSTSPNNHTCEYHMVRPELDQTDNYIVFVRDPIARFQSAYDWQRSVIDTPIPEEMMGDNTTFTCKMSDTCPAPRRARQKAKTGHAYPLAFEALMLHFDDANHLAESIYDDGEDGEIAQRLMQHPSEHIAKGIGWYLYNGELATRQHRTMFVGSVEDMRSDMVRLSKLLGVDWKHDTIADARATAHECSISEKGVQNLRRWYNSTDYTALRELVRIGLLDPTLYDLS